MNVRGGLLGKSTRVVGGESIKVGKKCITMIKVGCMHVSKCWIKNHNFVQVIYVNKNNTMR
jgi:hypothetical protein